MAATAMTRGVPSMSMATASGTRSASYSDRCCSQRSCWHRAPGALAGRPGRRRDDRLGRDLVDHRGDPDPRDLPATGRPLPGDRRYRRRRDDRSLCQYLHLPVSLGPASPHRALGAIVAVLTLGYTLFLVPVGTLMDARGERSVLLVGLTLLAVGAGAVTVAPSYPAVLAVVIALSAAYASAMPGTNKAILEASGLHTGTSRSGSSRSGSPRAVRSAQWSSPGSRVPGARASSRSRVSRLP
ncbi:hypothetical protein BRC77_10300 [Halobacteriales archaeon QH_8_64_26]|nr:MAG: hypothetical protein BRC77_10300 [Halobacteriales archaeon QH_8_64_26]